MATKTVHCRPGLARAVPGLLSAMVVAMSCGAPPPYEDGSPWNGVGSTLTSALDAGTAGGLAISQSLTLDRASYQPADTLHASVAYANTGATAVTIQALVITIRPPGGTHTGGPYDNFSPQVPSTVVQPGDRVALDASWTLPQTAPVGTWDAYSTYQDSTGWHDGPDVYVAVGLSAADAGSSSPPPSTPTPTPIPGPSPSPSPTPDVSVLSVRVLSPGDGATLAGLAGLDASATSNVGVASVAFFLGPTRIGSANGPTYAVPFDSSAVADGIYALTAVATDLNGASATSAPVIVTVANGAHGGGCSAGSADAPGLALLVALWLLWRGSPGLARAIGSRWAEPR